MRLKHIVWLGDKEAVSSRVEELGISYLLNDGSIEIYEDDPLWKTFCSVVTEFELYDKLVSEFSEDDIANADFFMIIPGTVFGYPENSNNFGYLETTYDGVSRCECCGAGTNQVNPFKLKAVPSLKRRSNFMLNWVFDEFFVLAEKWRPITTKFNLETRPVMKGKTELQDVEQLVVSSLISLEIPASFGAETCNRCGVVKYSAPDLHRFTPAPKDLENLSAHIFKSEQWFGAGGQAFRLVIITRDFFDALADFGISDLQYRPCGVKRQI